MWVLKAHPESTAAGLSHPRLDWPEESPDLAHVLRPYMLRVIRQERYNEITFVSMNARESKTAEDLTEASAGVGRWATVGG
jgi:hypothetical protein